MRVAVIGLGNFAERAYLAHLAGLPGVELHWCTRNRERLDMLADRHGVRHRHTDVEAVLDAGVQAAFVHAATSAHRPLVDRLLGAGIHVYVDKPLDDSYEGARRLVETAEREGRSLMVGFNRRYAPAYLALRQSPRQAIVMHKHRAGLPRDARELVFGDFIHVVDTLRHLVPGPVEHHEANMHVSDDGTPQLVTLTLSGPGFTALGTTQRIDAGASESVECVGDDGATRRVEDLDTVATLRGADVRIERRAMWSRTPWQRGAEQIVDAFLAAVAEGRILSARDALRTHEICEEIVTLATR